MGFKPTGVCQTFFSLSPRGPISLLGLIRSRRYYLGYLFSTLIYHIYTTIQYMYIYVLHMYKPVNMNFQQLHVYKYLHDQKH